MSLTTAFKTLICAGFTSHVNKMSLHTADPGTTGAHDSGVTPVTVTWGTESNGLNTATVTINGIVANITHIGLWEGTTFRMGIPCAFNFTAPASVTIDLAHDAIGQ